MKININLVDQKCVYIKWTAPSSSGSMVILASEFEKKTNKFKRAFKDCYIYYKEEFILTLEKREEIENEAQRIS